MGVLGLVSSFAWILHGVCEVCSRGYKTITIRHPVSIFDTAYGPAVLNIDGSAYDVGGSSIIDLITPAL